MESAKVPVARLASRQFGRVSRRQLTALAIDDRTIHDWLKTGYLHRVLPHVYAVGHTAKTVEADLMSAVLYAGPGATLSHATAAWWVGLIDSRPYMIDVSTPRRCKPIPGTRVHERRCLERTLHRGLPVTEFPQTMADYAARASFSDVRRALARADYNEGLNVGALEAGLHQGLGGATKLRRALEEHQPALADARSRLEAIVFELCETEDLPLPELNGRTHGWDVDVLWRAERLAVECDGPKNHRTPAQIRRDRRKDLELRTARFTVLRYSDEQINSQSVTVTAEIRQNLIRPAKSA